MNEHTPAPWHVLEDPVTNSYWVKSSADRVIAYLSSGDRASRNKDNAQLLASAPDLLEALEAVLPLAKGYDGHKRYPSAREPNKRIIKAAEAAIAKAKGEQDG